MTRRTLRAGMSGCGGIAPIALEAGRRSPCFDVVAIQDPHPGRLEHVARDYGISRRHETFEDLLEEDLDFVILNGPNDVHYPQVEMAAAAGVHCAVQKPMTLNFDLAEKMVRIADEAGIKLGVVMLDLGLPIHHQVKQMVKDAWFSMPVVVQSVSAHDIYLSAPLSELDWRRDPSKVGGGAFIQLAIHAIDLAHWILDDRAEAVVAATARQQFSLFEDETTLATVRFAKGTLANFAASYATNLYGFQICGIYGRVHLTPDHVIVSGREPYAGEIFTYDTPGEEMVIPIDELGEASAARMPDLEIHHVFAKWLLGEGDYPCPAEKGLEDMRVVDAAYRSVKEGRWIDLD